jgi:hypothetical protein
LNVLLEFIPAKERLRDKHKFFVVVVCQLLPRRHLKEVLSGREVLGRGRKGRRR